MKNYLRCLYAILAVPLIVVSRYALLPLIGYGIPYITLFPVTVGVALLAGLGPSVMTGLLSSIIIDYLFVQPLYTIEIDIAHFTRTAVVVLTSVFVGYVGDALRAARAKAEKQALSLREGQKDFNRAQAVAHIGSWRLDVLKNELTWSDEAYRIFSVPKGMPLTYESFLNFVHPDDREYVDKKWKAAMTGENYDIEHRIIVDGLIKWVRERAELEFDKQGILRGGFGTVQNITERKQMEEELRESRDKLERRVEERTAQLTEAIKSLGDEMSKRTLAEKTVKAERQQFSDVLDMLPAYVVLLTPDYHVTFANRFFEERFGKSNGKRCFEYLFGRNEPCEICETYNVLKTNAPHEWEWTGPDGRNYFIRDFPFTDVDGSTLIMEMGIDITEQKRISKELRSASLYARSLIEASLDPLITIDPEGKITDVNEATIKVTGISREQLIRTDFSNYFTEPKKAREGYKQVFAKGFVTDYPLTIHHKDGTLTDVLYNATVYKDTQGNVIGVFAAARDITERKRAEEKILADQEQLRSLTTELILTEERERRAIAAALHDSLGPLLAFSKRELGTLQKSASAKLVGTLDNVRDYISQAIDQTRTLTFDLSPPTLYTFGLEHAIEELTGRFSEKGKLECVLKNNGPIIPPTDDIKIMLYRSVRELFVNIAKHAQARSVQVNLSMVGNNIIEITVEDDGVGFDMADIDPRTGKSSGFGLFSIYQRLTQVGGQFDIQSKKGKGTKVILLVPLKGKKTKKGE